MITLLVLIPFYLLGTFPTGAILAKLRGVDLKAVGSGNVGATNVSRALGKKAGLITLAVDVFKGWLAASIGLLLTNSEDFAATAGLAAVLGHCFSIPGVLRGGKGVATALGVVLGISPLTAAWSVGIFAGVFGISGMVSLASISSALATPVILLISGNHAYAAGPLALVAIVITLRHWSNLQRIIRGEEPRFGKRKQEVAG